MYVCMYVCVFMRECVCACVVYYIYIYIHIYIYNYIYIYIYINRRGELQVWLQSIVDLPMALSLPEVQEFLRADANRPPPGNNKNKRNIYFLLRILTHHIYLGLAQAMEKARMEESRGSDDSGGEKKSMDGNEMVRNVFYFKLIILKYFFCRWLEVLLV